MLELFLTFPASRGKDRELWAVVFTTSLGKQQCKNSRMWLKTALRKMMKIQGSKMGLNAEKRKAIRFCWSFPTGLIAFTKPQIWVGVRERDGGREIRTVGDKQNTRKTSFLGLPTVTYYTRTWLHPVLHQIVPCTQTAENTLAFNWNPNVKD